MREKTHFNFALRWQQSNPEARRKRQLRQSITWAAAGTLIILLVITAPLVWMFKLQLQQYSLKQEISALNSIDVLSQKANQLTAEVNNQKKVQELAKTKSEDPQSVMDLISKVVPQGAIISSFSLKNDTVTIQIQLPTPVDVARLWTSLNDSHMFANVDIQSVSLADKPQTLNLNLKLIKQSPSPARSSVKQGNSVQNNGTNTLNGVSPATGGMAP